MRDRWLTPDELPDTTRCWAISIPDSIDFLALLKGALDELRFSSNWEQYGDISPEDTALAFAVAFDTIAECSGGEKLTGEIIAYATASAPDGTLACDGSSHLRVDYPDLYSVLASAFITDADHFITPDLRGRSIVGIGTGSGLTSRVMNASGGEENHTLTAAEMPVHSHAYFYNEAAWTAGAQVLQASGNTVKNSATQNAGSGNSHNTMHPFRALGYAIVT